MSIMYPSSAARRLAAVACRLAPVLGIGLFGLVEQGWAQAAVDPNVAPRAAVLERQGERRIATEMLGRYLAVAPDDGRAWFQLGRFYLLDTRDWHARAHSGEPGGALYLDFAATAFDQAMRLVVDSAVVYRALTDVERALLVVEAVGWDAARGAYPADAVPLPPFIGELGANLLNSCPASGVLLTGDDLETLAVWYGNLAAGHRPDVLPLRPNLYATDARYRRQMARALEVDTALSVQQALATVAARRIVCLTPGADSVALPDAQWTPLRLVRVSRPDAEPTADVVTVTEYVNVAHQGGSVWIRDVRAVYVAAARRNALLCRGLMTQLGEAPPPVCR